MLLILGPAHRALKLSPHARAESGPASQVQVEGRPGPMRWAGLKGCLGHAMCNSKGEHTRIHILATPTRLANGPFGNPVPSCGDEEADATGFTILRETKNA